MNPPPPLFIIPQGKKQTCLCLIKDNSSVFKSRYSELKLNAQG